MGTGIVTQSAEEAISLFTVQDEQGQVDSSVPLRWCISHETARRLQSMGVENPYMLIVIEQGGYETDRYIVPLTAQMCYVRFIRPGKNVIHATIVWRGSSLGATDPKKVFGRRSDYGDYTATVLARFDYRTDEGRPESRIRRHFDDVRRLTEDARLNVVVPKEMFAKEPLRLTRWLGNRYMSLWERAPRDPCSLRRRAIFTAATLPFVAMAMFVFGILLYMVLALNALVLLVSGRRDVRYRRMFSLDMYPKDIWRHTEPSVWWNKREVRTYKHASGYEEEIVRYQPRHPVFFIVNPPVILSAALVGGVLSIFADTMLYIVLAVMAVFVLGLLTLVVTLIARGPISRYREGQEKEREQLRQQQKEALTQELELLACNGQPREPSLSALPRGQRTVKLRYDRLKTRVCKPFAR